MPLYGPDSKSPMYYRHAGTGAATSGAATSRYYLAGALAGASLTGTATAVVNQTYAFPHYTGANTMVESLLVRVTTGVTGTAHIGIFTNTSATTLYPATRLSTTTDFSTNTAGFVGATGLAFPVPSESLIWVVFQASAGAVVTALPPAAQWPILGNSIDATNYQFPGTCFLGTNATFAALPTTFQTDATAGLFSNTPAVWMRMSS